VNAFIPKIFKFDANDAYRWRCFERITIAIVTWNRLEHTQVFLDSLARLAGLPYELLIIENGSTDGTVPFLRDYAATRADTRVVENGRNVGISRAQKQIRDLVSDGLVVMMDNDVRLLSDLWLVHLLKAFHAHRVCRGTLDVAFGIRLLNCEEYGFRYGTVREVLNVSTDQNSLPRTSYACTSKDGDPAKALDEQVLLACTEHLMGPCTAIPASVLKRVRLDDAYPRPIGGADAFISAELRRLRVPMAYIENGPVARHEDWPYSDEKVALYTAAMKTRAVTDIDYVKWKLRRLFRRA